MNHMRKSHLLFTVLVLGTTATSVASLPIVYGNVMHAQSSIQKSAKAASRDVVLTGTDYAANFTQNRNATINGDTATLTPDAQYQVGNTILNNKIDMTQSFTLKGKVNLGDKSKLQGGADGVGFAFQPGDTDVIGNSGNAMGVGGVKEAFGFKLDTYYNEPATGATVTYTPDPAQFMDSSSARDDYSFGGFLDGTSGVVSTIESTAKKIAQPSGNTFKDITVSYDGTTKKMSVDFDGQSWEQDITTMLGQNKSMSFAIVSSTGTNKNLQQFQLESFKYTVAQGNIIAHFVDEAGNQLDPDEIQSGDINDTWKTKKHDITGWQFKEVQGAESGTYTANDQEVTYVYTKAPVTPAQGKVTAHYVDESGQQLASDETQSGDIATDWATQQKTIDGYTFKEVQGSEKGQYTAADQEVTYVYTKSETPTTPAEPEAPVVSHHEKTTDAQLPETGRTIGLFAIGLAVLTAIFAGASLLFKPKHN
ncbi:MucBP domain-containing protein [Weissella diestrammenae]|uniref:MucBP domain-containing protein n=1 Tax=Weissella diestrammenae TaxID=1162633 RepID=A0A7G9T3V3_9LACO|nr:MucBP domain-containing protein [Weissella diestrammenae]MCM0582766.1 MucBP domain-containing protein [Weissella diestrammenae]QNN74778.1 MucBP domain-containing protein [Weissella diestrammenae]